MLASIVLRPTDGSPKATVTSSSERVSLRAHDDPVAEAAVADAIAVAVLGARRG